MRYFPQFTQLGQLELIEVYEYYDRPVLLSCANAAGHIYLALLVDEAERSETWYFVGISQLRYQHIRSGAIDLYSAFRLSEDGFIIEVQIPVDDFLSDAVAHRLRAEDVPDERLPYSGELLNLTTETLPKLFESISRKADQAKREFLRLRLELQTVLRTEAPAKLLGDILHAVQDTVDAIGQTLKGDVAKRGPVPYHIRTQMELMVVEVGSGSFEIELASAKMVDLFNESDVGKALQELIYLINLGDDEERLREQLRQLKIRVAAKYASLLRSISERVDSTNFEWGSPAHDEMHVARVSADMAKAIIEIIERTELEPPERIEVRGQLIGANLNKKNYEIWTKDMDGNTVSYSGRVEDSAIDSLTGAILNREYLATLLQLNTINSVTGEVEERYVLVELSD
jgi:hypothetical protein